MGGGWKVHPGPGVNPERQQEWDVADSRPISYCALCGRHQPELLVPSHPSRIATHLLFPKTAEKLVSPPPCPPLLPPPLRVGLVFLQMFVFSAADENIHYLVSCGGEGSADLHFPS